jgi:hypothetical protein
LPYPDKPQIQTSYTAQEQALGDGSLPGQELDVDFANLKASVEETIDFVKVALRSDGKLTNGSVTSDSLAASIRLGFNPPAPWATATAYTTVDTVFQGFGFYLCTAAHTSGTFATDLASGRWLLLADLTPPGGGLIADQNLADLADAAAARGNLGLGTMATAVAGTGSTQFQTNAQNDADFQPLDADLTSWAAVARASGFDTFAATPSSANLRALVTDESGTGALLFAGGALGTPASGTLTNCTGLPFAGLAGAAVRTSGEGYTSPTDTEMSTTAWVEGYVAANAPSGTWTTVETITLTGTSVETSNFVAGSDYRFVVRGASHNSSTPRALAVALFGETTGAYGSDMNVTKTFDGTTGTQFVYGLMLLTQPRTSQNLHIVQSQLVRSSTASASGFATAFDMAVDGNSTSDHSVTQAIVQYPTAEPVLKLRFRVNSGDSLDAGTLIVQRRVS